VGKIKVDCQLMFSDETDSFLHLEDMFSKLLDEIIKTQDLEKNSLIESLTLVGDEKIHVINREYRHIDRPTDVISFGYYNPEEDDDLPIIDLGEVIISVDTAKKQALEFNHPLCRELAFLFIHGSLHNLGYDHEKNEVDANIMYSLQNKILNSFDWKWEDKKWLPKLMKQQN